MALQKTRFDLSRSFLHNEVQFISARYIQGGCVPAWCVYRKVMHVQKVLVFCKLFFYFA